jgi:hypothetical protein
MDGVYVAGLVLLWGLMALLVQGFKKLGSPKGGRS